MCGKAAGRLGRRAHNKQANIFAGMCLRVAQIGNFQFAKEQFFLTVFFHTGFCFKISNKNKGIQIALTPSGFHGKTNVEGMVCYK